MEYFVYYELHLEQKLFNRGSASIIINKPLLKTIYRHLYDTIKEANSQECEVLIVNIVKLS